MADEDIILFLKFVLDRFSGVVPDEQMLWNALADFKAEKF